LICSDGLWGAVDELEMFEIINNATSLNTAAVDLVQSAYDYGGPDNISAVLIERVN
jgi:serine/threonine protein phosphatase PrpC